MLKKILIANRGEIAVRVIRACRELGVASLSLYQRPDERSLHVRLADECVPLESPAGFMDQDEILRLAVQAGADAIHPGYGFLAERADFIRACAAQGLTVIGGPAEAVALVADKVAALECAQAAGFATVPHSSKTFVEDEPALLRAEAERLGYPLKIKARHGGQGRGETLVNSPDQLERAVATAFAAAQAFYADRSVYLEKALPAAHTVSVPIAGDRFGRRVHLGERDHTLVLGNQQILVESAARQLSAEQRSQLWRTALDLASLFKVENLANAEFLLDGAGRAYFTEIKARLSIMHPATEALTRVDLVQQQILLAAGEPLSLSQEQVNLNGWAMTCRLTAEDPWQNFRPAPGQVQSVRWPQGPEVRVDSYVEAGGDVPSAYETLIAKLTTWAPDRPGCVARLRRALGELSLAGIASNLPLLQQISWDPGFADGSYTDDLLSQPFVRQPESDDQLRQLAAAAAVLYTLRRGQFQPCLPERLLSGWHRAGRSSG